MEIELATQTEWNQHVDVAASLIDAIELSAAHPLCKVETLVSTDYI